MNKFSLEKIRYFFAKKRFPFAGITELGSAEFHFREPANYLGIALHNGSRIRPALLRNLAVGRDERFREEDPYTRYFIEDFPMQMIARDSRFEYDLNWEIENCIYSSNEKKWGFQVWNKPLSREEIAVTHAKYREFHALLDMVVEFMVEAFEFAALFDIHSFRYRRAGEVNWWEDEMPEINLGTRSINRSHFLPQIELFLEGASEIKVDKHPIRVAENALFPGGYLTRKYAGSHFEQVLVLAIEYKKIFMDEGTGELYPHILKSLIGQLLLTKDRILRTKL